MASAALTREEMIAAILAHPSAAFQSEIRYHRDDIDREDDDDGLVYDTLSALYDAEERNEGREGDRAILKAVREAFIQIGRYRVMTADEIANTWRSDGRAAWSFKLAGVPYTSTDEFGEPQFAAKASA